MAKEVSEASGLPPPQSLLAEPNADARTTPRYSVISEESKCGSPTRLISNESGRHALILRSRRAEALHIKTGATSGALAFLLMDGMHIAW